MKWFKHDANAILDSKLKKLKLKYGMEGYGLYWYCLECIARNVEAHNLTFELEEDAELIACDTNIHYERVEEMMRYMVSLRLFEQSNGIITCLKMAARTDEYTQKLLRDSGHLKLSRQTPDSVPIKSLLIEENRIEENNNLCASKNDAPSKGFDLFWDAFAYKRGRTEAEKAWKKIKGYDDTMLEVILQAAREEAKRRPGIVSAGRTPKMAQGWITGRRWEDETEEEREGINDDRYERLRQKYAAA